ncbi:unnamed protein product [Auanema sp. JU1783]|nr:unnamed protein product [Auanema sp. JU1783]
MSSSTKLGTVADCSKLVNKSYSDLLNLLNSFDKGATSELTQRLRQVETVIQDLRESVKQIPDIGSEEQKQRDKIKDLYR